MSEEPLRWEPYDCHWIRLRGPWVVDWLKATDGNEQSRRVRLPASWEDIFGDRRGTARFKRRFQRPTNLDADERVVITLCEVRCEVAVSLNDRALEPLSKPLGDPESALGDDLLSFDVTEMLEATNQLVIDLSVSGTPSSETPCGLWKPVLLEVITVD